MEDLLPIYRIGQNWGSFHVGSVGNNWNHPKPSASFGINLGIPETGLFPTGLSFPIYSSEKTRELKNWSGMSGFLLVVLARSQFQDTTSLLGD